jgi:hypothetical protein
MKLGFRQSLASAAVFAMVMIALTSVDGRVRDRFEDLMSGTGDVGPWSSRAADLGHALVGAVRHQSIDNAPLLIFAAVSAVLVLFMLRT